MGGAVPGDAGGGPGGSCPASVCVPGVIDGNCMFMMAAKGSSAADPGAC